MRAILLWYVCQYCSFRTRNGESAAESLRLLKQAVDVSELPVEVQRAFENSKGGLVVADTCSRYPLELAEPSSCLWRVFISIDALDELKNTS